MPAAACQLPGARDSWHWLARAGGSVGRALLFPVLELLQVFSKLWSRGVVSRGFHQCQLCQLFCVCGYSPALWWHLEAVAGIDACQDGLSVLLGAGNQGGRDAHY